MKKNYSIFSILFCAISFLSACGGSEPEPKRDLPVRALQPTFTPTPRQSAPAAGAATQAPAGQVAQADATQPAQPPNATTSAPANLQAGNQSESKLLAVINSPIVNLREGPATNYRILQETHRGDQFEVIGKVADGSWWQVCCVESRPAWVKGEFVDTEGAVENAPLVAELPPTTVAPATAVPVAPTAKPVVAAPPPQPAAVPQPVVTQPPPPPAPTTPLVQAAPPAPAFEFNLQATDRFPETNVMRVFMFVIDAGGTPMAGYSLRVNHNGVELPVNTPPTQTGFELTWPINDSRQRFQNFKVEFPGESRSGTWEAQLVRDGQPVGPAGTFTVGEGDPNGEMYVRYQKK